MYSQSSPWENTHFLPLLWSGHSSRSLLHSEFLPSSLHAVVFQTFSLSDSPPSHSSLAIFCNGTNSLFSRASSIQCEVVRARRMGSLHSCSLLTELYKRDSKSQPTKQIMQDISLPLKNKTLFFVTYVIELYILTETFQMSTSNIVEKNNDI